MNPSTAGIDHPVKTKPASRRKTSVRPAAVRAKKRPQWVQDLLRNAELLRKALNEK